MLSNFIRLSVTVSLTFTSVFSFGVNVCFKKVSISAAISSQTELPWYDLKADSSIRSATHLSRRQPFRGMSTSVAPVVELNDQDYRKLISKALTRVR